MRALSKGHETAVRVRLIGMLAVALALAGCAAGHPAAVAEVAPAPASTVLPAHYNPVTTVAAAAVVQLNQLVAKAEREDQKTQ